MLLLFVLFFVFNLFLRGRRGTGVKENPKKIVSLVRKCKQHYALKIASELFCAHVCATVRVVCRNVAKGISTHVHGVS